MHLGDGVRRRCRLWKVPGWLAAEGALHVLFQLCGHIPTPQLLGAGLGTRRQQPLHSEAERIWFSFVQRRTAIPLTLLRN